MTDALFDVHLTGQLQPGFDQTQVINQLSQLLKTPPEKAATLLGGKATRIKAGIDLATAQKYRSALEKAGAAADIQPVITRAPAPVVAPVMVPASAPLQLEPKQEIAAVEKYASAAPLSPVSPTGSQQAYQPPQQHNLHAGVAYCNHCGGEIRASAKVCPHCNGPIPQFGRSKNVAAVLALLFTGSMGIHRFYLGQWWGIFYLLFSWTLIPSLVSLVEFFVFLLTNDDKWNEKYGNKPASNILIWIIPGLFILIALMGILAAIAIPAYQDYETRAKVTQTLEEAKAVEQQVEEYLADVEAAPSDAAPPAVEASGDLTHASYSVGADGVIELTLHGGALEPRTIVLTPMRSEAGIEWDCTGGSVPLQQRPVRCRGQAVPELQE